MRGAPSCHLHNWVPTRIIPADAGSTAAFNAVMSINPDHPRGCGEHGKTDFP